MKRFRVLLSIFAIIIIIGQTALLDFDDLSWKNNDGNYLGILSMLLLILSIILSQRDEARKN